jgi:large subunit ribosomal protein L32
MPNPKRKISKTRRDKRRTHHNLTASTLTVCPTTKEAHLTHRAVWVGEKMYYKGRLVIDNSSEEASVSE